VAAAQVPKLLDGAGEVRDLMGNPISGAPQLTAAPIYVIQPGRVEHQLDLGQ
jgi:hypothetical protein